VSPQAGSVGVDPQRAKPDPLANRTENVRTLNFYLTVSAVVGLLGTVVAFSFELLPERVDLVGFVLQGAGTGALVATTLAVIRQPERSKRAGWVELGNACGGAGAAIVFAPLALIQPVASP
jgi:sugar phosphate permease